MRVMILSALYPPIVHGGAEKAAWLLAEALAAEGDDVSVVTMRPEERETVDTLNGVRVYRIPMDNLYWPFGKGAKESGPRRLRWHLRDMWNPRTAARVGRILDLEKPEVVNSHLIIGFSPAVWREVRKRKIRLVHTMHDYYLMCPRADMFGKGKSCQTRCAQCKALTLTRKIASGSVDAAVSVSGYVLAAHTSRNYLPEVPGSVIYNIAASPKEAAASGLDAETALSALGPLVFGFLGRLDPFKGVRTALEATRLLISDDWRMRVGGAGLESNVLALKAAFPDPRIEWLGFANPEEYFRSIHISIVPSLWADPFPYAVVESHLHGKPVLHSDSGGIPEAAALGRKTASFPAGDASALAALMNSALARRGEWLRGGFRDPAAREMFSAKAVVERYRAVYENRRDLRG